MAYYIDYQMSDSALGTRRPTVNEYFLSTYTMGIYDGCEIGCPYCDGWSMQMRPFNETVRVPLNIPDRVAADLTRIPRDELIGITAFTDPYQQAEANYRLTRQTLRVLADHGQPTLVLTKSPTILEDLVLLERINKQSLAIVMFTILTIDPYLSEKLEDKAAVPLLRLDAITALKRAGIPVGVALLPVLPYVNDTDFILDATIRAIAAAGADFIVWDFLNIPNERHRARINEMLARIGRYPPSYYRDLYNAQSLPEAAYRSERSQSILQRCDALNLQVRVPHKIYAGRLNPRIEATLLLKHQAFRDAIQGRHHLAYQGQELAERIYQGIFDEHQLASSPLYSTIRSILARKTG